MMEVFYTVLFSSKWYSQTGQVFPFTCFITLFWLLQLDIISRCEILGLSFLDNLLMHNKIEVLLPVSNAVVVVGVQVVGARCLITRHQEYTHVPGWRCPHLLTPRIPPCLPRLSSHPSLSSVLATLPAAIPSTNTCLYQFIIPSFYFIGRSVPSTGFPSGFLVVCSSSRLHIWLSGDLYRPPALCQVFSSNRPILTGRHHHS